jgi:hypothetical protein
VDQGHKPWAATAAISKVGGCNRIDAIRVPRDAGWL